MRRALAVMRITPNSWHVAVLTMNADGSDPTLIANNSDLYGQPSFSPDGSKIMYAATSQLSGGTGSELVVMNSDGSDPVTLTLPATVQNPESPSFSPDGRQIAFENQPLNGGGGWNVWTANADGSSAQQLTTDGTTWLPTWSSDGSQIIFDDATGSTTGIFSAPANGSGAPTLIEGSAQGYAYAGSPSTSPPGSTAHVSDDQYLAEWFEPVLMFDSTEKWRPLNVDDFLSETDPTTGAPYNEVCSAVVLGQCAPLTGIASLRSFAQTHSPSNSYIDMPYGTDATPENFVSPLAECRSGFSPSGNQLHDCDTGSTSSIYYHVVGPSPGGYDYIDYWFFYRYNQAPADVGNHAGDWEGVTIGVPSPELTISYRDLSTFSFAEFSQDGTWEVYLRGNLECDSGGPDSCEAWPGGPPVGSRVMTYPEAGNHANFPTTGSGSVTQNGYDGQAPWGNNYDTSALLPFPAAAGQGISWQNGPENWTDWPGLWGQSLAFASPASPAGPGSHATHYYQPWVTASSTGGIDCSSVPTSACPSRAREAAVPFACANWFGSDIAVLGCNEAVMRNALRTGRLGRTGGFTVHLINQGRSAATAPGVAQVLGRPLRVGERAYVVGDVPAGTTLFVRAFGDHHLISLSFKVVRAYRGRAVLTVSAGRGREPVVVLRLGHTTVHGRIVSHETVGSIPSAFAPSDRPNHHHRFTGSPAKRGPSLTACRALARRLERYIGRSVPPEIKHVIMMTRCVW
jgi:hypothetical protein